MNRSSSAFNRYLILLAAIAGLALASCNGGGGGGGGGGTTTPDAPVTATFTMTPGSGNVPLSVYFDASGSASTAGTLVDYTWNFGDGSEGSGQALSHAFNTQGDFTITLTVQDDAGNQASMSRVLKAGQPPAACTVSGNIRIASGNIADSDTNDPNTPLTANNTFETAQEVVAPTTIGGYVNQPFSGSQGSLYVQGDRNDVFKVTFAGNETIGLSFPSSFLTDLDLYLYDENLDVVDSSRNFNGVEALNVPGEGTYYIRVFAFRGASTYILTLGQEMTGVPQVQSLKLSQDFVPGEAIVCYQTKNSMLSAAAEGQAASRPILMKFNEESSLKTVASAETMEAVHRETAALLTGASDELLEKDRTLNLIKALNQRDDVLYAEPNYLRKPYAVVPDDPHYPLQWHYPIINLPQAWETTTGSPDVVVAVVDTGVLLSHPDLAGQLVQGYDFISSPGNALDGNGIDDNPDDPGDSSGGTPSSFHGTHVAGTIAAASNNGIGVAGVAWNSRIMPLRILGLYGGTTYDTIQALRYAAGLENDSGTFPAKPADIINMSFGSPEYSQAEQAIMNTLKDAGILLVAAAGNESTDRRSYPAAYTGVISVGAVTMAQTPAYYTNYGSWVDLVAPGGDTSWDFDGDGHSDGILSTCGDDSRGSINFLYTYLQGTSMAAPHMAGVLALMKSVNPQLSPSDVTGLMGAMKITDDLGVQGRDNVHGWGIINAQKAVAASQELIQGGGTPSDPVLVVSPGSLNFGTAATSLTVTASNGGDGDLWLTFPTSSSPWLTVSAITVDAMNLGTYRISIDRSSLTEGSSYSGSLLFQSSANTITVPVSLYQPAASDLKPDLGTHYVQLRNNATDEITEVKVNAQDGKYTYSFTDVSPGIYWIYAGNDPDNDYYILSNWEAAGGYQTLDSPTLLYVNGDKTGIDFYSGYGFAIAAEAQSVSHDQPRLDVTRQPVGQE